MVKSWLLASLVVGGALALWPQQAAAQGYGSNPVVSPYLNLVTADQLGFNAGYQNFVQPFVEQRRTNNANQAAIQRLQTGGGGRGGGSSMGIGGRFMNYSHYYQLNSSGMAAGGGARRVAGP